MDGLTPTATLAIGPLFLAIALLYSSVGHGGGSGYLAIMALAGAAPGLMKPTALALNLVVATIALWRFSTAGHFSWSLLWPFAATSVPAAFLGGMLSLPGGIYRAVAGVILLLSAARLAGFTHASRAEVVRPPPAPAAFIAGAGIGLLSGLVGVGGGIFLSPLLLLAGWARAHETAGVSAAFILVNSASGLLGHVAASAALPSLLPVWALAVAGGGYLGASFGSRRLPAPRLRRLLGLVLLVAGGKLILT